MGVIPAHVRCVLAATLMLLGGLLVAGPLMAARFPLDCHLGESCWVVRLPGARALAGSREGPWSLADEDHRGLDLAVRDLADVIAGVGVRALADGVVVGVRDGEPDGALRRGGIEAVRGRECGNGVRIRQDDGLISQYCHLRRGSVMVRQGDRARAGQLLGLVGLSGLTSFPHLHLQLERDGRLLDPAATFPELFGKLEDLRRARLPVVTGIGLALAPPPLEQVLRGDFRRLRRVAATTPVLVLWVRAFHLRKGDRVDFRLWDPEGRLLLQESAPVPRDRALGIQYAGRRRPEDGWRGGRYRAVVEVRRGEALWRGELIFTVE